MMKYLARSLERYGRKMGNYVEYLHKKALDINVSGKIKTEIKKSYKSWACQVKFLKVWF